MQTFIVYCFLGTAALIVMRFMCTNLLVLQGGQPLVVVKNDILQNTSSA